MSKIKKFEFNDHTFDYLIVRSGIIGRQILRLCKYISKTEDKKSAQPSGLERIWLRQRRIRQLLGVRGISWLLVTFYSYYIGGSLTRRDQTTFGRLLGMDGYAYRLTLFNALFCGIPCAAGYFFLGEGFSLLRKLHSYAELPSLLAQHTALGIGFVSLTVDLFRAADSFLNRRCWAPFGVLPMIINIPTYLKQLFQPTKSAINSGRAAKQPLPSKNDSSGTDSVLKTDDRHNGPSNIFSKDYSDSNRVISHSK